MSMSDQTCHGWRRLLFITCGSLNMNTLASKITLLKQIALGWLWDRVCVLPGRLRWDLESLKLH